MKVTTWKLQHCRGVGTGQQSGEVSANKVATLKGGRRIYGSYNVEGEWGRGNRVARSQLTK